VRARAFGFMDQKKRIKREQEKGGKKDSTKKTTITAKKKRKMLASQQFMKQTCFLFERKSHVSWIQKYISKLQLSSTV
jgi:hypothetical protein